MEALAPAGTQLAVGAAVFKWLGAAFMVAGFSSASHSSEVVDAHGGDPRELMRVMQDFNHSDCVPLIQDRLVTMSGSHGWFVMDGLCDSIASLLALCAILCLKTQMNWNRTTPNELELICFAALGLGLVIPMLEFCLRTGPVAVAAAAGSAATLDADAHSWSGTHFQFLYLAIMVVESLFTWLNVLAFLLLAVGFLTLSYISAERASLVIYTYHRNLGYAIGGFFLLCFFCGLAREAFWFFDLIVLAFESLLGLILLPIWFVMLGIGLANCSSIQDLKAEFGDMVAIAAAQVTDTKRDASEKSMAERAAEKADRPGLVERAKQKAAKSGGSGDDEYTAAVFSNPMTADMELAASSEEEDAEEEGEGVEAEER
jgi:hypothetical protein